MTDALDETSNESRRSYLRGPAVKGHPAAQIVREGGSHPAMATPFPGRFKPTDSKIRGPFRRFTAGAENGSPGYPMKGPVGTVFA